MGRLVAAVLLGAYLLISGISQVFSAFTQHATAGSRVLLFISGAASLILAVLAFAGGYVGVPRALGGSNHFDQFLSPVLTPSSESMPAARANIAMA